MAQDQIMNRKYNIIDDLTLNQKGKHKIMQHTLANIEPYFHQQEKVMDYRSEIELILLKELMATEISESSFDNILCIIK
jgi:hypothetical protein